MPPPPLLSFIIHFQSIQTNRRYLNMVGGEFEKKILRAILALKTKKKKKESKEGKNI